MARRRKTHISSKRRQQKLSRFAKHLSRIRKHISLNFVAWLTLFATVLSSGIIYYLAYSEPDLRLKDVKNLQLRWIDSRVDEDNNALAYMSMKLPFKNYSIKSGYLDRVEFVPESIEMIPEIRVTHIDKQPILWRRGKDVEVMYLVTMKRQALMEKKSLKFKIIPYDNTGRVCFDEAGEPAAIWSAVGHRDAVFEKYGRPEGPFLEMRISRLSVYDECWQVDSSGGYRFLPWIGVDLEVRNLGKQGVELRDFKLLTVYKPLGHSASSDRWYTTGTRQPNSPEPFGAQERLTIAGGDRIKTHITFTLRVGEASLTKEQKEAFFNLLDQRKLMGEIFGETYLKAYDLQNQEYDSEEFFKQGEEIMFVWDCARSKTSITYPPQNLQLILVERDIWRDGANGASPRPALTLNESFRFKSRMLQLSNNTKCIVLVPQ